ncbi:MAG: prolyl-tRNA synthetase associated domain-containing protein [Culturomica sp.]|jgi:Ala-tRNA(Pro) deacylase|nr:prolyl-tRNA synthetase associated domain-containing protein [Culturomica sp.]
MVGQEIVYKTLENLGITFDYIEHPPTPTVEIAKQYWSALEGKKCKNLFFRNHKGNRHYLVVVDCDKELAIKDLEQMLKQGKLSFASEQRMLKYLGLYPGSVSPFGLLNDTDNHVYLFLDENLKHADKLSFHPNDNRASISLKTEDFVKFLDFTGNDYEWIKLY